MLTKQEIQGVQDKLTYSINHGDQHWNFLIPKIEKERNCRYIGEFCLNQGSGWTEFPAAIFYQETPPVEGYSHYFGIYLRDGHAYVTSGQSAADVEITGVISNDNEIIYSRFRHDYRISTDGTVMVDGGRDYLKTNTNRCVRLKIVKDELVILGLSNQEE